MKVSILIPCYNAAPFIEATLVSALVQRAEIGAKDCEIIVYDDGSTDNSVDVARRFESHIHILGDGVNRGGNVARNCLLENARGQWLQYLDADDVLPNHKIARQLRHPNVEDAAVIQSDPVVVEEGHSVWNQLDHAGNLCNPAKHDDVLAFAQLLAELSEQHRWSELSETSSNSEYNSDDPWVNFIRWGAFQTSSLLLRSSAVKQVGGWKHDQPRCQEHELLLRLLTSGFTICRAETPGAIYRVRAGASVSRRSLSATALTRLGLTDVAEAWLKKNAQWNRARRNAAYSARLEMARSLYQEGNQDAFPLFQKVGRSAALTAAPSPALPWRYRIAAILFGYRAAESLASRRRR